MQRQNLQQKVGGKAKTCFKTSFGQYNPFHKPYNTIPNISQRFSTTSNPTADKTSSTPLLDALKQQQQQQPRAPRTFAEYKQYWADAPTSQRCAIGLQAVSSAGILGFLASQPNTAQDVANTFNTIFDNSPPEHYQQQHNHNNNTTKPKSQHTTNNSTTSPLVEQYMTTLHNTTTTATTSLLSPLTTTANRAMLATKPGPPGETPPYEYWDARMAGVTTQPEWDEEEILEARRNFYQSPIDHQEFAYTLHKEEKFAELMEDTSDIGILDGNDEVFAANLWMIAHASPKYLSEHKDKPEARQATLMAHGLQDLPPLVIDGRLYPTYETYMQSQGFKPATGPSAGRFDTMGSYSLAALFAAITLTYNKFPSYEPFFHNNFTLCYDNRWKPWTYITNAYTHFGWMHLGFNTMAMLSFAPSLGVTSAPAFYTMFTALGLSASIGSLAMTCGMARLLLMRSIARPSLLTPAVGASGALTGCVAISALTNPDRTAGVLFIPYSFNIMDLLGAFIAIDAVGFVAQCMGKSTGLSHAGHLAGYASGIALWNYARILFEKKYAKGSYRNYNNWMENTFNPKPVAYQSARKFKV